jgi:uncharacterized LabA/DUF88 family protein
MNRVAFLIDGFNLYHSIRVAQQELGGASAKWLDIKGLCGSYLHLIGGGAQIAEIYYFSALAKHLEATNPDVTKRHRDYITCLEATGIQVKLGRFKNKKIRCDHCNQKIKRHEEKETDVAIAAYLLECLMLDRCDTVVLMTGDTDLAAVVKVAQRLFPDKEICFAFPYKRKNNELQQLVSQSFQIDRQSYAKYQLSDPFICPNGNSIPKPPLW